MSFSNLLNVYLTVKSRLGLRLLSFRPRIIVGKKKLFSVDSHSCRRNKTQEKKSISTRKVCYVFTNNIQLIQWWAPTINHLRPRDDSKKKGRMSSNWSCVEYPAVFHQVFHLRHSIIWLNAALIVNHRKRERDDGSNIKWHFPSSSTASCSAVRLLSFQFSRGPDSSLSLLCRRETPKFSGSLYTPVVIKHLNFHFLNNN